MTHRDFAYWLQGYMEINDPKTIDERSLQIIKEHMRVVLEHQKNNQTVSSPFGTFTSSTLGNITIC
jgi:hypothetical protein